MPVENIHQDGSLMFNKTNVGTLSDCVTSLPGDVLEDDEFDEDMLKQIKDKDPSVSKYWRYLSESQAKTKRADRDELEKLATEAAAARAGVAPEAFLDSTGPEGDKTIEQSKAEQDAKTTVKETKSA